MRSIRLFVAGAWRVTVPEASHAKGKRYMDSGNIDQVLQKITDLARIHIAGRAALYDPAQPFPFDIWEEWARQACWGLDCPLNMAAAARAA